MKLEVQLALCTTQRCLKHPCKYISVFFSKLGRENKLIVHSLRVLFDCLEVFFSAVKNYSVASNLQNKCLKTPVYFLL